MSWRIVYIEKSDYLSLYLDNIKVRNGIDDTTIPLSDINSIVIDNNSTTITLGLINKCMEYKINIITCDITHLPTGIIIPYSGNYQSSYQFFKQMKWDELALKVAWQYFVRAKVNNQIRVLKLANKNPEVINKLKEFESEIELGDITNREGLVAKMYFRELYGTSFKRFNENTINAAMNYGYSILRSQISRALIARGLNPHLGIFHRGPENSFNLSDDFIECFRPIVDLWIYNNINDETSFNRDIRLKLIEITTKKINYEGKRITIINAINILIDKFLMYMDTGAVDNLIFPDIKIYDNL